MTKSLQDKIYELEGLLDAASRLVIEIKTSVSSDAEGNVKVPPYEELVKMKIPEFFMRFSGMELRYMYVRTVNLLKYHDCSTVEDLTKLSASDIKGWKNSGDNTLAFIVESLMNANLHLYEPPVAGYIKNAIKMEV